ncbi:MAG: hypothetical protein JXR37_11765, partial [Kiritimatiellae bacterium]|nr:hypothetical protein [Kiritimatiellia bacterium]
MYARLCSWSVCVVALGIASLLCVPAGAATNTFTVDTVVTNGDLTYEGDDIIVNGCTLTIDGPHTFNSLSIVTNGTLTHPACTNTAEYRVDLTISNSLLIESTARIAASARGYLRAYTAGNTTTGGATGTAGGSHGGLGHGLTGNWVYDDFADPAFPGAGGGTDWGAGGVGGGLVRIAAANATIDGSIRADGEDGYAFADSAGAGGGIRLDVG